MAKNFIVKADRLINKSKGLGKYIVYLEDKNNPEHANNEIIEIFNDGKSFYNTCVKNCTNLDLQNTKGGRQVNSYGNSFDFPFPPGVLANNEDYQELAKELIKVFKEKFPLLNEDEIFINAHKNLVFDKEKESCGHLNVVVSRVSFDSVNKRYVNNVNLDRLGILSKVKQQFDSFILRKYKLDPKNYVNKKYKSGVKMPLFKARKEKLNELNQELESKNQELNELNELNSQIEQKKVKVSSIADKIKLSIENANKHIKKSKEKLEKLNGEIEEKQKAKMQLELLEQSIENNIFFRIIKKTFSSESTLTKELENKVFQLEREQMLMQSYISENSTDYGVIKELKDKHKKEIKKIEEQHKKEIEEKDKIIYDLSKNDPSKKSNLDLKN